jgi:hypothetical protein
MTRRYLSVSETAKLVRDALKKRFPGQKFSVRSNSYSGGASIDVEYAGNIQEKDVKRVVEAYEGARFDAMVDLKTNVEHWLMPDGTVKIASKESTYGSERIDIPRPSKDAELVSFGADYIFVKRKEHEPKRDKPEKKSTASSKKPASRAPVMMSLDESMPAFEELGTKWASRSDKRAFMFDKAAVKLTDSIPSKDVKKVIKSWYDGYDARKR